MNVLEADRFYLTFQAMEDALVLAEVLHEAATIESAKASYLDAQVI